MPESNGNAPAHRRLPAAALPLGEPATGPSCESESIPPDALLPKVLDRTNLQRALKQVRQNQGAPGIDGMTVDALPRYLKEHWLAIREHLETGRYRPQPVKRVDIPKGNGNRRHLGIPTVLDRFIQQAIAQVISTLKGALDRPCKRSFLGFTVSRNGKKRKVADKALDRLKAKVRALTRRTGGKHLHVIVAELRCTLLGWKAYFDIAEVRSPLRDIDKWIRRKLRCYIWKQWGRSGYRNLRKRGVKVRDAWHMATSAHGPWRMSQTPALALALPVHYLTELGLPSISARQQGFNTSNRRGT